MRKFELRESQESFKTQKSKHCELFLFLYMWILVAKLLRLKNLIFLMSSSVCCKGEKRKIKFGANWFYFLCLIGDLIRFGLMSSRFSFNLFH
jgi:hypothetical protein